MEAELISDCCRRNPRTSLLSMPRVLSRSRGRGWKGHLVLLPLRPSHTVEEKILRHIVTKNSVMLAKKEVGGISSMSLDAQATLYTSSMHGDAEVLLAYLPPLRRTCLTRRQRYRLRANNEHRTICNELFISGFWPCGNCPQGIPRPFSINCIRTALQDTNSGSFPLFPFSRVTRPKLLQLKPVLGEYRPSHMHVFLALANGLA